MTNGLPLSKIHHAAFDANPIGVDPDYRIHISDALLSMGDGPLFEHGIKAMAGRTINLPSGALITPTGMIGRTLRAVSWLIQELRDAWRYATAGLGDVTVLFCLAGAGRFPRRKKVFERHCVWVCPSL